MVLEFIRKRKFLIAGIFLLLLAADVLMTKSFIIYDVKPRLGEVFPYVVIPPVTNNLPDYIITMYSWPFLTPALLGIVFTGIGLNRIRSERQQKFTEKAEIGEIATGTKEGQKVDENKEGETSGSQ